MSSPTPAQSKLVSANQVTTTPTMEDLLKSIARDDLGLNRLLSALECLEQSLVSSDGLRDFFEDLHTHWSSSGKSWHQAWDEVARGAVASNRYGARGYVRRTTNGLDAAPPPEAFTTVIDVRMWQEHHLVGKFEDLVDDGLPLPDFPVSRNPAAAEQVRIITEANKGWVRASSPSAGAWLGYPSKQNANCWVSSALVALGEAREMTFSTAQQEMAARGVVVDPNIAAVRYYIEPSALNSGGTDDPKFGCRPGLADCGSVWFRVTSTDVAANRHRKHGWGSTVNLDRLGEGQLSDTGLPERVIRSIAVDSEAITRVELVPPEPAGAGRRPPDKKRFVKRLKSHRSASAIVRSMTVALGSGSRTNGATV